MRKTTNKKPQKKKKKPAPAAAKKPALPVKLPALPPKEKQAEYIPKDFLDIIAPGAVKFNTDHYILGNSYRTVFALRGYPTSTEELALLRHLGDKSGVTLSVYARQVTPAEERKIIHDAANKNRMNKASTSDLKATITAEANLQDVAALIASMHKNREPLMHCAVFIELSARSQDGLRTLQNEVMAELVRSKLSADRILLRQQEGFHAVNPAGWNCFGSQYERVLPASSVANLFPFNYSGKTDPHGFYVGKDRYGSNIIVDLDRRAEDKTNGSVLILGNSGEGKSFLLKLLLENLLESGKTVICLDPEHELEDISRNLGGCFIDLMSGRYIINPLEPKLWDIEVSIEAQRSGFDGGRSRSGMSELSPTGGSEGYEACGDEGEDDSDAPEAFRQHSRLSQHISFLKDFFRAYKDFTQWHIDTIELMLERLYKKWGIDDGTDFARMGAADYPILSDLYAVIEDAYRHYDEEQSPLYTKDRLQEVLLGLHSMCVGAESKFFNGHTNITSDRFLVFGVKGLLQGMPYHNAVFVGRDEHGVARHAHKRSTNSYGSSFRMNVESSDPRCSFHHVGTDGTLFVFEAPIDLMSFISMFPYGWEEHSYVACCGTSFQPVEWMLERIDASKVYLCLDNDKAGQEASDRMEKELLSLGLSGARLIPTRKDWNEDLVAFSQRQEAAPCQTMFGI